MTHLYPGFYYYDWVIPNSLPVFTYTVRITGTVDGDPTAMTVYVSVLEAGSPTPAGATQREIGLIDALNVYINPANRIPIYNELARRNRDGTIFRFNWPRWNLGNPEIRRNGEIITPDDNDFQLDMDAGVITFDNAQHPSDVIEASYNFRLFSTNDMRRFLSDALNQMNVEPPMSIYSLENVPDNYVGVLLMGATKNAMKQLIQQLSFQEPRTIFGDPELAKEAIENFKALKENNEKEFKDEKINIKKRLPKSAMVVGSQLTLPGGRSRWFRMLFTSSMG